MLVRFFRIKASKDLEESYVGAIYKNGLETKISRTFVDFLHLGHEFSFISGHGT